MWLLLSLSLRVCLSVVFSCKSTSYIYVFSKLIDKLLYCKWNPVFFKGLEVSRLCSSGRGNFNRRRNPWWSPVRVFADEDPILGEQTDLPDRESFYLVRFVVYLCICHKPKFVNFATECSSDHVLLVCHTGLMCRNLQDQGCENPQKHHLLSVLVQVGTTCTSTSNYFRVLSMNNKFSVHSPWLDCR